jgi:hypothetical protein
MRRLSPWAFILGLFAVAALLGWPFLAGGQNGATVSGVISAVDGRPLGRAWVRVQATANLTFSAADGGFTLGGLTAGQPITITAWYVGYKIGWNVVTPPATGVGIVLRLYDTRDNPAYTWNTSYPDPQNPAMGCGHCMAPAFPEWRRSAHAGSAVNPRFFTLYNGTDVGGRPVAPGYKLDFPGTAGNCGGEASASV